MIYSSALMDFIQLSGIAHYLIKFKTNRGIVAFAFFMIPRSWIQSHFLMGRQKGFLWYDPGVLALTVPYHDTNDFYYSGHIGTATLYMHEFFVHECHIMGGIALINYINCWFLMIFLRTHYVIDLITGFIIALWCLNVGEMISYPLDVKIAGWDSKERRH